MTTEILKKAVAELEQEGLTVEGLYVRVLFEEDVERVAELLGEEGSHRALQLQESAPGYEELGEVQGIKVWGSMSNRLSQQGYFLVNERGSNRIRHFWEGERKLCWLESNPVKLLCEWVEMEGQTAEWMRLGEGLRWLVRSVEGVSVEYGSLSEGLVLVGVGDRVRAFKVFEDGAAAVALQDRSVDDEGIQRVLEEAGEHVGWSRHRSLRIVRGGVEEGNVLEGLEYAVECGECSWRTTYTELMCGAVRRWDLLEEKEASLVIGAINQRAFYERPSAWERL